MTSVLTDVADQQQTSLGTAAARNLASTTKSAPQMQEITPRWLLRLLPWVDVQGGTFRVNRRANYLVGDGRVSFTNTGAAISLIPPSLGELPLLRGLDDDVLLQAVAAAFTQEELAPGDVIGQAGAPVDRLVLIAHGKVARFGEGDFGHRALRGALADGDHIGDEAFLPPGGTWEYTVVATTPTTLMTLSRAAAAQLLDRFPSLRAQVQRIVATSKAPQSKEGEAHIEVASGHVGETALQGTYVDYDLTPREYQLSVSQTILQMHTRVADLYNQPMNQLEQQLRLTVEALRERQEYEILNNPEFGLLPNAGLKYRIQTVNGPPAPGDLDELLSRRRRSTKFLLAHPRAIAAFRRECNHRGIYPDSSVVEGTAVTMWRGYPIFPTNKIPISAGHTTSILAMRTGLEDQGVIGLHQTGIPDEHQPGLSVRFMGINDSAVMSYLVSTYYSAAILVPDALGVLENVELGH